MKNYCEQTDFGGCSSDKTYAVFQGDRLIRLTFSRSLADHIVAVLGAEYSVKRITFRLGKKLQPNETSSSGLYAVVSCKNDFTLRISLFKEAAQLFCDWDSRYLAECWILN